MQYFQVTARIFPSLTEQTVFGSKIKNVINLKSKGWFGAAKPCKWNLVRISVLTITLEVTITY